VPGCCEDDNKPAGSIQCGEFVDYLRNLQILKKSFALVVSLLLFTNLFNQSLISHRPLEVRKFTINNK